MKDARASVSVVIPTHRNIKLLRECLDSVRALDYPRDKLETMVVDNASGDETADTLRRIYPYVRHLRLEQNEGFAQACDRGAAQASSDYVAFLNDDAVADARWLSALFAALEAGGEGAVCVASHIRSRDGKEVEYSGASANLFGVGRPRPVWGWPDAPELPGVGSPVLFASGGAMLVHRRTYLDAGGFDPHFFAYFEDVDFGWRLWVLGHRVVYAPDAVVRHTGGATGSRSAPHRRYTLWECNSLATVLKNYEVGNMERVLTAAQLLLYKRAILSSGGPIDPAEYKLTAGRDTSATNVERMPKVCVAHLAAIRRFNHLLPYFMRERRRIQAARIRPDREILPLLGRVWEPQYAGREYASAARDLARKLDLYGITHKAAPNRVLVLASIAEESDAHDLAASLQGMAHSALALLVGEGQAEMRLTDGVARHTLTPDDLKLHSLIEQADAVVLFPGAATIEAARDTNTPIAVISTDGAAPTLPAARTFASAGDPALLNFCLSP